MVVPGTDLPSSQRAITLAAEHKSLYAAVGLHPHHAQAYLGEPLESLQTKLSQQLTVLIKHPQVVAIGEIGLDRYQYQRTKYKDYQVDERLVALQQLLFELQLELAYCNFLPVIIHNRQATQELLVILTRLLADNDKRAFFTHHVVFHCCEPKMDLLEFALEHDFYLGVDGDVTYNRKKQAFVQRIPLEKLLIETDAPFLTPRPPNDPQAKRSRCEPADIIKTAQTIADLRGIKLADLARITTANARRFFNLPRT